MRILCTLCERGKLEFWITNWAFCLVCVLDVLCLVWLVLCSGYKYI
jgi:hypothetical protein